MNSNSQAGNSFMKLIPVMFAFFVMGFVDLVGIATNYVKSDFNLSDTLANLLPSMVFLWFLVLSIPTGLLMNRIGRRKTVIVSLIVTAVSLLLPVIGYSFAIMMVSFCLLGIGNTLLQVSINPLLSNIVSKEKLASNITFGQFVKAIASFLAPIIAGWAATYFGNWKLLFPIFMVVAILATVLLGLTHIKENDDTGEDSAKGSTFLECFSLLGNKLILLSFIGVMCHVGIDVGFNLTAPKVLIERLAMPLEKAGLVVSLYFIFRTTGSFVGSFLLARFSQKAVFGTSVAMMAVAFIGLFFFNSLNMIYVCVALIGLGNSNIFPVILSSAMLSMPEKKNEASALMVMGLIGGTVFPLVMGVASDAVASQDGALAILLIAVAYLIFLTFSMKKS